MKTTGLVILAAGASSRLGEPKQNLEFRGKSLLNNAISIAIESKCQYIVVVTGASDYKASLQYINHTDRVNVIYNTDWKEGISSSIKLGLNYLQNWSSHLKEVIFMVCDQPYVTSALLNCLIEEKNKTGKSIVACTYQNTLGTPVLFDQCYFETIYNLKGEEGAKKIILNNIRDVVPIPFQNGYLDIDTKQDYYLLKKLEEDKHNV